MRWGQNEGMNGADGLKSRYVCVLGSWGEALGMVYWDKFWLEVDWGTSSNKNDSSVDGPPEWTYEEQ